MKAIVIADTHLGVTKDVELSKLIGLVSTTECPVIWLGDAVDTVCYEDAYEYHKHLMKPCDIWISGNHDYGQSLTRTLQIGNIFMTHGDLIDFGYVFGRLQQASTQLASKTKSTYLEIALACLRNWSLLDVYTLYDLLYQLTDQDIKAFKTSKVTIRSLLSYLKVLIKLIKAPTKLPAILPELPAPNFELAHGYASRDPEVHLRLILELYPEARYSDTIVIGHVHHHVDKVINVNGKDYRFITLGAWTGDVQPTYMQIKEDNTIEIIQI